jgi:hypothetical protein
VKIANPERTLGEVMAEQGKRPNGWYEIETLIGALRGMSPDWVRIDDLTIDETRRLRRELADAEVFPWRYEVDRSHPGGMVSVRAHEQRVKVPETQPQRLGSRQWEADPSGYFGTAEGIVHTTSGPVLAGSEHDPRLGPDLDDDEDGGW